MIASYRLTPSICGARCDPRARYTQLRFIFMKSGSLIAAIPILLAPFAAGQPAPIHVLVSNGVRAVVEDLQPQCEKAVGHPLAIEYSAAALLKQKVDAGQQFD